MKLKKGQLKLVMSEELNQRIEEAKSAALDIEDGKRSRYWGHLRKKINGWKVAEEKHLSILNQRLIHSDLDIEERNDSVKRLALLAQFLTINEDLINEKLGIIGIVQKPDFKINRSPNFVGNHETNNNGG